jgi:ABC-type transport system involved in cytochrome bd biosynthesis fused ATPase/permease subunit
LANDSPPLKTSSQNNTNANITNTNMPAPNITTKDLTFAFPDGTSGLQNVSLTLPAGSRNLLIGGKHILPPHHKQSN